MSSRTAPRPTGVHAVAGDDLLVERRVAEIRAVLTAGGAGTEEVLAGERIEPETLEIACRTVPLLGRRLVVVRHADRLSDTCLEVLEGALDRVPDNVAVLLIAPGLDRRRRLYAELERRGSFEALVLEGAGRKGGIPLGEILERLLSERGLRMESDARQRLLDHVGADGARLEAEVEKLSLMFGEQSVTVEGVVAAVGGERARVAFALEGALRERRFGRAVLELRRAAGAGDAPELLLAQIAGEVRALLRARALLDEGLSEPEARRAFGSGRGWFAVPAARHYRRADLEALLLALARVDAGAKVGLGDAIAEIEAALVDLGRAVRSQSAGSGSRR